MNPDGKIHWVNRIKNFLTGESQEQGNTGIDKMLQTTLEKAKRFGGDPFAEYRKAGALPSQFEYGMNCFYDRVCEDQGHEVAQLAYEELVKRGKAKIEPIASLRDIGTIPVLFGVKLSDALETVNRAVERYNRKIKLETSGLKDTPTFLQRLEHETERDYFFRLAAISSGCTHSARKLIGKDIQKGKQLVEQMGQIIVAFGGPREVEFVDEEASQIYMYGAAISRGILHREPNTPIADFLTSLSSKFENKILELIVSSDQPVIYLVNRHVENKYFCSYSKEEDKKAMRNWSRRAGSVVALDGLALNKLQKVWDEVKKNEISHQIAYEDLLSDPNDAEYWKDAIFTRIFVPEKVVLKFLRAMGYQGGLLETVRAANRSVALFVAQNLTRERMDEKLTAWYKGEIQKCPVVDEL